MYLLSISVADGSLKSLEMVPIQIRNFRLNRVMRADAEWIWRTTSHECQPLGNSVGLGGDNTLSLAPMAVAVNKER